jgi:hypothetical protein
MKKSNLPGWAKYNGDLAVAVYLFLAHVKIEEENNPPKCNKKTKVKKPWYEKS